MLHAADHDDCAAAPEVDPADPAAELLEYGECTREPQQREFCEPPSRQLQPVPQCRRWPNGPGKERPVWLADVAADGAEGLKVLCDEVVGRGIEHAGAVSTAAETGAARAHRWPRPAAQFAEQGDRRLPQRGAAAEGTASNASIADPNLGQQPLEGIDDGPRRHCAKYPLPRRQFRPQPGQSPGRAAEESGRWPLELARLQCPGAAGSRERLGCQRLLWPEPRKEIRWKS